MSCFRAYGKKLNAIETPTSVKTDAAQNRTQMKIEKKLEIPNDGAEVLTRHIESKEALRTNTTLAVSNLSSS